MTGLALPQTVGIVGVGAIGLAIAERLIAREIEVWGYRRSDMSEFRDAGGLPKTSPEDVAFAETVILMLPTDAALDEIMRRIAPVLRPEQLVLCLGSHRLPAKLEAAALAASVGATLLDGEISGTPAMLRAGQASVLLAGDELGMERSLPLLALFAHTTTKLGEFGGATRMKLITNYLVALHTTAAAEVLHLGRALGLTPKTIVDAVAPSAGGSTMLAVRGRMMAEGTVTGSGMAGFMTFFDRLRAALPDTTAEHAPLFGLVEGLYRQAVADGFGNKDIAAIHDAMAGRFKAVDTAA